MLPYDIHGAGFLHMKLTKFKKISLIFLFSLGITIVLGYIPFQSLESSLYDFRLAQHLPLPASKEIVLITIDEKTSEYLNDYAPLPLKYHTEFLQKISAHGPKAIGYLINMNHVHQINPQQFESKYGKNFVETALKIKKQGITLLLGTPFDINGEILPPFPLSQLPHSIAILHKDGNIFSDDNVTRRALLNLYNKPAFHLKLLKDGVLIPNESNIKGAFTVKDIQADYTFFRFHENSLTSENPYKKFSFSDILENKIQKNELKDKIILVDTLIRKNPNDFIKTPSTANLKNQNKYSRIPKILVHANILDTLLNNQGVRISPPWVNLIITFVIILLVSFLTLNFTPIIGVIANLSIFISFLMITYFIFQNGNFLPGVWIKQSQPIIGIFLSYYLLVPYRLIKEYESRWHFQRKTKILKQVEELKTNFMSLVTHDLKTPVARIQGISEILSNQLKENPQAYQLTKKITHSTEELDRFINSILELSKIESKGIHIDLKTKDINRIIEQSISELSALAQSKGIKIDKDLEPLFPIKIDPRMLSKVINNLIDNAIKYSPKNSVISITSKELLDYVEIIITDQGIGISQDESKNLFKKFYRAKNDSTTQIPGTGLGLYLSKYFIEAHQGEIIIESQENKGTSVKIRLPLELKNDLTGLANLNIKEEKSYV